MKLKFTAKGHFQEYHGAVDFVDGEEKEVDDIIGKYLIQDFGGFFSEVKPVVRHIEKPPQDRQIKKGRTKTR